MLATLFPTPAMRPAAPERPASVIVVDDDPQIRELLGQYLKTSGFEVHLADSGAALMELLDRVGADIIVLDLMLPGESGLDICQRVRSSRDIPILMLTARADPVDRIVGIELGADDYLTKPFVPRELAARLRAVLKRTRGAGRDPVAPKRQRFRFENWVLDTGDCVLHAVDGSRVDLTGAEYRLLHAFVSNADRVVSRDELANRMQGRALGSYDRSIDVAVSRMRRILGDDARAPRMIKTVHALGYRFCASVTVEDA